MEKYSEKNIKELENQLLSKIGYFSPRKKDAIQYEKVNRYLYLVRLLYELKAKLHEIKEAAKEKEKEHELERLELQNAIDELQDKLQEANDDYVNLLEAHTDLIGRFDNEKED